MWRIGEDDVERLADGAAVLGAGGGGNTYLAGLDLRRVLRQAGPVTVLEVEEVPDDAIGPVVGGMGAPTVGIERLPPAGRFGDLIVRVRETLGRPVDFVAIGEIGGANALRPLTGAGETGLPVVDADPMGRAFPELQMSTYMIAGLSPDPVVLNDGKGVTAVLRGAPDGRTAERYARALTWAMGGNAALSLGLVSGRDLRHSGIPGTLRLAYRLGEQMAAARSRRMPVADAIAEVIPDRVHLFQGKVVDVVRRTTEGFARGHVIVEGLAEDKGRHLRVDFQNEYLIAREEGEEGAVHCTVPDLLVLLDEESGRAVGTELLRYGLRVEVLGLPAPWELRTQAALAVVGPTAFGYDLPYRPLAGDLLGRPQPRASSAAASH